MVIGFTKHPVIVQSIFVSAFILAIASCKSNSQERGPRQATVQGDTIQVEKKSPLSDKIKTGPTVITQYRQPLLTAGTVKAIPTQFAEIAPPFAGRVTRSYLKLGMKCTPETPLFEISSPDFIGAQKIFFQEKTQLEQAKKALQRQKDLVAHGVGTQKDLEEAETAYEVEKKEYENAVIGIKLFKTDPDKLVLGQPLVVRAPISGEIIENKVVLGQFIKNDAASVATIAELSKIWIVGQVKEKDIRYIHALDDCEIDIAALPEKRIKGNIYHVEQMVDEETRSLKVLVEADNKDHTLKPGMYVTIHFNEVPVSAILIPSKSLLQMNDASFVFVQAGEGKYVKRKVETAGSKGDSVVIKTGLNGGETIVSEGGFYLLGNQ